MPGPQLRDAQEGSPPPLSRPGAHPGPSPVVGLLLAALLAGHPGPAVGADVEGWRHGGSGVAEGAEPPIPGAPDTEIRWKVPTGSWGNASPVSFGDQVCITEEPTTLACYDKDSGTLRWSASNGFVDTLEGDAREEMVELFVKLDRDEARLDEVRVELGRVQRELRQPDADSAVEQEAQRLVLEMDAIKARLTPWRDMRLTEDMGTIGYASPTPLVVDDSIYALFGSGVLSRFTKSGERLWSVWLGQPLVPMIGNDTGSAASPLMVDGVVVAPFGRLAGVEPGTGQVLWRSVEYPHFGTPAVVQVEDRPVLITPGGDLLSPKDGAVLGPSLGQIDFVGPVTAGTTVWTIGADSTKMDIESTWGRAFELGVQADGGLTITKLWERQLNPRATWATPLAFDERVLVLYVSGELDVLHASTGQQLSRTDTTESASNGSPSPILGNDVVIIGYESGNLQAYSWAEEPRLLGEQRLEPHFATPLLEGDRIYVRGLEHLHCID